MVKASPIEATGRGAWRESLHIMRTTRSETHTETSYRYLYDAAMKTTLDINDQLLANAKVLAAKQRTSLTRLIEEGLQLRLRSAASPAEAAQRRIPVLKGRGGLVAGVNPLSNKAMLNALDDDA
jgi:Family of unknown function (DUF6364)